MKNALRVLRPVYKLNRKARGVMVFVVVFGFFLAHVFGHLNWWQFLASWILTYNLCFLPEAITSYCHTNGKYTNPERGITLCGWALELDPQNEATLAHLTNCYSIQGMCNDALEVLDTAISYYPQNAELYCRRALINYQAGNLEKLIDDADRALKLAPNLEFTKYVQSIKFLLQSNFLDALSALNSTKCNLIDSLTIDQLKHYCLVSLNQTELAKQFVSKYADTPYSNLFAATQALHIGDCVELLSASSHPGLSKEIAHELQLHKGIALMLLGESAMAYRLAVDLQNHNGKMATDTGATLLLTLACHAHMDDTAFSIINYLRAQKHHLLTCQIYEAWIYLRHGQLPETEEIIETWERLNYRGESYFNYKSLLLTKKGDNLDLARELAEKSCQMYPFSSDARLALGAVLTATGQPDKAIAVLAPWIEKNQMIFECYKYLAQAYEANGDHTLALETLERKDKLLHLFRQELKQAMEESPFDLEQGQVLTIST